MRSPLIAVQPPTKLKFRQNPETPELLNKYIFYDTDITPEGKKRYLTGMSTVRYLLKYLLQLLDFLEVRNLRCIVHFSAGL